MYRYSLLWPSVSERSKLCGFNCKALRGKNGENLKAEEDFFFQEWTTHAWLTVAHADNHVVHAYVIINHFVQLH